MERFSVGPVCGFLYKGQCTSPNLRIDWHLCPPSCRVAAAKTVLPAKLVFASPTDRYAVLTHPLPGRRLQSNLPRGATHAAVANIQAKFLQLFGHSRAAIAAQTEARLFFDMRQRNHIR